MTASSGVAAAGLACAIAWTAADTLGPQSPHITSLASDLEAKVREAAAGVRARAETLAQLPRLEVAVATDVQTIRDLTADELAFRPHPNELIEIAQVPRIGGPAGTEGAARTMLRIPDRGPRLQMGESGVRLQIWQGQLHVAAVVPVEPRERARELRGAVAVDQTLDLSLFSSRIRALGLAARVQIGSGEISLGGVSRENGGTEIIQLGAGQDQVKLVLQGLPPAPSRLRFLGPFALALVSTGAARVLKRRRPVVEIVPAPTAGGASSFTAEAPVLRPAPKDLPLLQAVPAKVGGEYSNATRPVAAPGIPEPMPLEELSREITAPQTDYPADTGPLADGAAARQSSDPDAASTLPCSLFETSSASPPLPLPASPPNAELDREYRGLFAEFVKLRQACREPIDNLNVERFVHALRWKHDELAKSSEGEPISFRIAFHSGRAAIRLPPIPKKPAS